METKPLLYGLIGFFLGGLLVSVAATTFDKPACSSYTETKSQMAQTLVYKGWGNGRYDVFALQTQTY